MYADCGDMEPHGPHWIGGHVGDDDVLYDQVKCMGVNEKGVSNVMLLRPLTSKVSKFYDHPSTQPPGPHKMTTAAAVAALDHYITSIHTISFGNQSMVSDPVARENFIDWFINVCEQCGMIQLTRPEFRQEYPT